MSTPIDQGALLKLRMRAQRLTTGTGAGTGTEGANSHATGPQRIAATASHMLAMQGQDWRSSRWALGLRTPGTTVSDVYAAFNEGRIVRSWPMRGTLHIVAAEDIGWMQSVTNHRVLAGAAKRRNAIGITNSMLDRLVDTSIAALQSEPSLARDELSTIWTESGIDWQSSWRYHVIWWLCQNGLAVFGPQSGDGEPRLVEASTWIRTPRSLDGNEALAELTARYAAARGPIRRTDLAWWSGLTLRETDRGIALAVETDRLTPVTFGEETLWVDPELLDAREQTDAPRSWQLLPSFDEHLLGYSNREAQLNPAHFDHIVPGKNGMFLATVVASGYTAGTWKPQKNASGGITVTAFPEQHIDLDALASDAKRWSEFHGLTEQTLSF